MNKASHQNKQPNKRRGANALWCHVPLVHILAWSCLSLCPCCWGFQARFHSSCTASPLWAVLAADPWWGPLSVCRCKLQQAGSSHCRPYVHVVFIILMFNLRGISGFVTCHTVNVGQLHHIAAVPAVPARRPPGGVRCRHGPACLLFGSSQHKPT